MISFGAALITFALLAAPMTSVMATTFYERPFPEAVKETPFMVRGKVGMKYVDWAKGVDGSKRIYTFYELKIDEVFKGDFSGTSLIMRELGGEKDGVGMQISGVAEFRTGEDTVVMLGLPANPDGSYDVRGMMMAKFNVIRGEDGGERLVGPGLGGGGHEHVVAGARTADAAHTADTEKHEFTLDDLRKIVRDQGTPPKNPHPAQAAAQTPAASVATPAVKETASPQATPSDEPGSTAPGGFSLGRVVTAVLVAAIVVWASRRNRKRRK